MGDMGIGIRGAVLVAVLLAAIGGCATCGAQKLLAGYRIERIEDTP